MVHDMSPLDHARSARRQGIHGRGHQCGATLVEFTLVAPVITLLGLLCLQWALTFHARNQLQHAGFMAARAGATGQAQPAAILSAYTRALAPLYGGGRSVAEVELAAGRAEADLVGRMRLEIVNPSTESFDDWADPALQQRLAAPRRVIPNDGLSLLSAQRALTVGLHSRQTLADANQLRLRITTGLPLQVPFAAPLVRQVLRWSDDGRDAFVSGLLADGRMPVTVDVMVRMQSPAMESAATGSATVQAGSSSGFSPAFRGEPIPTACSTLGCAGRASTSGAPPTGVDPVSPVQPAGPDGGVPSQGDPLFCPSSA